MDKPRSNPFVAEIDGLSVSVERELQVATLRYFHHEGSFAAALREAVGSALPEPLRAIEVEHASNDAHFILAWRSPTETLLLCEDRAAFAELELRLAAAVDGCMVNQTGGVCVLRVRGPRAGDLLVRLGATTAIPGLGEARSGRLAELHVLTACVQAGQYLLLVERVYANHLLEWISATAADF
jgi:heterotetrameric sarcosine oxidase gamma subunit